MLNLTWIKNPDHVSYCKENEVLPRLARELGIADLAQQVEEFRTHPTAEGVNLKGKKRTTLKLFIPNLTFPEPVEMGENVRASTSLSIPTRSANITPATRCRRGRSSTACSATARFICWGGSAGETSPIWKAASRTVASAWYPTAGRTMDLLPTVSRRLLARWRNGRRRKDSKRRFQPIHSEMHMKKRPTAMRRRALF